MYLCCRLPISNVQVQFFFVPTTVNVLNVFFSFSLYIQLPPFAFSITQCNQSHSSAFLIAYDMHMTWCDVHVIRGVCGECVWLLL